MRCTVEKIPLIINKIIYTYDKSEPSSIKQDRNDKVPADTMDSLFMSRFEPLVDDKSTQEKMNNSPDPFNPEGYILLLLKKIGVCQLFR